MRNTLFLIALTCFCAFILFSPNTFAEDYTTWRLPEGAKTRLGKGTVDDIAYSPDGTRLAVAGSVGIWLYDAVTGETLDLFIGHTDRVYSVSFSADGLTLASGSWDKTVRLWDVGTGSELRVLQGHTEWVESVSFSADGQTLASGSEDGTVRLWDVATGSELRVLHGHTDRVYSVSFSPDGQTLASGGDDETVRLWDVGTGSELRVLHGHTDWVESVSFSPDGRTLASGSYDGTVLLWELIPPEPLQHTADVNGDGIVNIQDLVQVAGALGEAGQNAADVNGDGIVNIQDLVQVAGALGGGAAAPALHASVLETLTTAEVQGWLTAAAAANLTDATSQRGIRFLEALLAALTPKKTALLANYPNPFNPETWIPYQLAVPADVVLHIHAIDGSLVRTLSLGHKSVGIYQSRSRAAYWDGRNAIGEPVASGVYFYTLTADDFTATRKMLIRK
ncbi:T9SS type A sorting domain-containing protein [Candidatus Poribacteria bacterium]|nr:T9SS type A sorting domain-containing protein [Candidatus Poribacteria bacterium]